MPPTSRAVAAPQFLNTLQKEGEVTTAEAIAWLEKTRAAAPDGRVFLWLHLYEPHDPYEPPEPYASKFSARPYDGEVAFADDLVGRLDAALARLRLADDTALVVTSDHGEGLGDHGETLHGFFVYQSTLRVPFFVRGPGVAPGTRLATTVQLVDVFPTALDLLGLPPPTAKIAGRSLAGALRGERVGAEASVYAESLVPLLHFGWSDLRVLREGRFKYIQAPRPELYDLAADPAEQSNLCRDTGLARRGAARRPRSRSSTPNAPPRPSSAGAAPAIAPELLEKLGALGYVGGSAPAETTTPGADPKDKMRGLPDRERADARRPAPPARPRLRRQRAALSGGPGSEGRELRGSLLPGTCPRWARPQQGGRRSLRRSRATVTGVCARLGRTGRCPAGERAQGRGAQGLREGASARPSQRCATRAGRRSARDLGAIDEAIRRQTEATELAPDVASYWNSLGMTLGGNSRPAEAERAFRQATRLDDKHSRYAYNLGLILLRQGRSAEARPWFEKTLALDPTFAPARDRLAGR